MRVETRSIAAFLSMPPRVRAVLFHGDDEALVRARADQVTVSVAGAKDDPFRVSWLFRDDHSRLAGEAAALSMIGGRRAIRVRDVTEALLTALMRAIATSNDSVIILESEALSKRSKLRMSLEASPDAAVVACYPAEGAALLGAVRQLFAERDIAISSDAVRAFVSRVGSDAGELRSEAEKLSLFVGSSREVTDDDVSQAVGDRAEASLDDTLYAATAGQLQRADRALESALEAGAAPVAICRMLLSHLARLEEGVSAVAAGRGPAEAARDLRPPPLFTRVAAVTAALESWRPAQLRMAIMAVMTAEHACKQGNVRDTLIVRRLVMSIAQMAARARR